MSLWEFKFFTGWQSSPPPYLIIFNCTGQGVTALWKTQHQAVTQVSYYCVTDWVHELLGVSSCMAPCRRRVQCLIKLVLTAGNFCERGLTAVSRNKTPFILLHGNEYLILLGNSDAENEVKHGSDGSEEPKEISADHLCRVCACKSDDLVPVFGEKGVGMQLLDKIHTHLPIMVNYKLMTNISKYFYALDKSFYEFWNTPTTLLPRMLQRQSGSTHSEGVTKFYSGQGPTQLYTHLLGSQAMRVTTYPYLMPRLRMCGTIPPLP